MKIKLNGQNKEFSTSPKLQEIITRFCKNSQMVIAEVNGAIVDRPQWGQKNIEDGDCIELVSFVGGG